MINEVFFQTIRFGFFFIRFKIIFEFSLNNRRDLWWHFLPAILQVVNKDLRTFGLRIIPYYKEDPTEIVKFVAIWQVASILTFQGTFQKFEQP